MMEALLAVRKVASRERVVAVVKKQLGAISKYGSTTMQTMPCSPVSIQRCSSHSFCLALLNHA